MRPSCRLYGIIAKIILIGLIQLACPPSGAEARPLRVGIMHFPPFLTVEKNRTGGIELEHLRKVLKKLNIEYTVEGLPPRRLYQSVANGQIDLIISSEKHPTYRDATIHSKKPIIFVELNLYAHIDTPLPKSKADWIGKEFTIINGYGYGDMLTKLNKMEKQGKLILHRSSKRINAFRMIAAHRSDYLLDYTMPSRKTINDLDIGHILHKTTLFKVAIYLILNEKVKDGRQLLNRIEENWNS